MPGDNELADMLRAVIQEELKPVRRELQELRHGQEMLGRKADKLELRMENDVIEKVSALYDGFTLRGEQIEILQKHLDRRLDSIEIDTGYLVSKIVRLEKMAK